MPVDRYIADLKRFYSKLLFLGLYFCSLYWYTLFSCSLQDYGLSLLRFVFMYKIDLSGGSEKPEFVDRP